MTNDLYVVAVNGCNLLHLFDREKGAFRVIDIRDKVPLSL
jgi:hypothetical protein